MKKFIITLTILLLTVAGIEASKGGSIFGGILGYQVGQSLAQSAGNSRGRSSYYYDKKIKSKERRNEKAQDALDTHKKELEDLKAELKAKKRNQ